jgi:hypothetical protein
MSVGPKKTLAERATDIKNTIQVDCKWLNFTTTLPGKILGSTLMVGNLTDAEQIVELSIDRDVFNYNRKHLAKTFKNLELPFELQPDGCRDVIMNSEAKIESWWIENPHNNETTKRITIKLGPRAEQDFIIVLKSPNVRKTTEMVSMINLSLLTFADE